jgi:hypothetical protein
MYLTVRATHHADDPRPMPQALKSCARGPVKQVAIRLRVAARCRQETPVACVCTDRGSPVRESLLFYLADGRHPRSARAGMGAHDWTERKGLDGTGPD